MYNVTLLVGSVFFSVFAMFSLFTYKNFPSESARREHAGRIFIISLDFVSISGRCKEQHWF